MLTAFVQGLVNILGKVADVTLALLPNSPFSGVYNVTLDSELLSALAWIVPFPSIIAVLEAWALAVGGFYVFQAILRTANSIE